MGNFQQHGMLSQELMEGLMTFMQFMKEEQISVMLEAKHTV